MIRYKVKALDERGNQVDCRIVTAWSRREAYFEVAHKMKPHTQWDAEPYKVNEH